MLIANAALVFVASSARALVNENENDLALKLLSGCCEPGANAQTFSGYRASLVKVVGRESRGLYKARRQARLLKLRRSTCV
jgi:hypothetical protein